MEAPQNNQVQSLDTMDIDMLRKMEDEHLRLQRQFKAIHADRVHRTQGVHPQFRRQDKLLRVLKHEYIDLVKDLKLSRSGAHKKKDIRMKRDLKRQLLIRNMILKKHDAGITMMDQIDGLLQRNNKHMLEMKSIVNKNMGEIKERRFQSEKRLVSSENRLEAAMLRFNSVQYENKKIREEIEHMLKDRVLFNQCWDKMLKVLCKGKKFLTDLFESSTVAYDLRDEWCTKLKSMMEKGKVDQMLQLQEMRDLQKAFDHEMKLFQFLARKGVQRVNKQQEEKEEILKKKEEQRITELINDHLAILNSITEYAEEESAIKIIEKFGQVEQENFAMYQLMTEICAKIVVSQKELNKKLQEVADRREWNEMKENQRQDRLMILNNRVELQKIKNDILKEKLADKEYKIKEALDKIAEMFNMLECSLEPYENLLGDKFPASRWQLNLTFTLINEKIKENLEIVYYTERILQKVDKNAKKAATSSRLKKFTVYPVMSEVWNHTPITVIVPADPCPACVEARWLSRVSDTPEVPFTPKMTRAALSELCNDTAYVRSDRIHALTDCRVPSSRLILAARYVT